MDNSLLIYVTVVTNIFMLIAIFIVLLYAFFLRQEHNRFRELRIELEGQSGEVKGLLNYLTHLSAENNHPFDQNKD